MSKGDTILIDEHDLEKIKTNIKAPLIQIKQGIINPSFMISIVPTDKESVKKIPIIETGEGIAKIVGYENEDVLNNTMIENRALE